MNLGNTAATKTPTTPVGLRVTQAVETCESSICLYLAGILLKSRKYTSERVRACASILLEERYLPVSVGFLEPLAAEGVTQPLPFGGDSENHFLNGLSAEERANHAIQYLASRLAAEKRVCKRVRLQVLNKFTQPMNWRKQLSNPEKLQMLVRDLNFEFSRKRLDCGCAKCVRHEVPSIVDPERQSFVYGLLYVCPLYHRSLSASERRRSADLAVALLSEEYALTDSELAAIRVNIRAQINLRDRIGRLSSEAALLHYSGDFAAQAAVESRLNPLQDRLYDCRDKDMELYEYVLVALCRVGYEKAATRADMLEGYAVCFAAPVPAGGA
jgi:hypothetical protein